MRARSAVFDLYGDHLASRSGWAPVAGVVALSRACDIAAPATRTALHRMVAQGWLEQQARDGLRGYAVTPAATNRLDRARARIYAPGPRDWNGSWHTLIPQLAGARSVRERAISALAYLGYGRLGRQVFISPWRNPEASEVLRGMDVAYTDVYGPSVSAPQAMAAMVWDLDHLAAQYRDFARSLPAGQPLAELPPEVAYPRRTDLVHRWRTFLFLDPGLPREALPQPWPGHQARTDFLAAAAALAPAASRFVDLTLASAGARVTAAEPDQRLSDKEQEHHER
ncbi:MAG: PaaX family transcriptional regulator C-terminal domain-containing protein [Ornithinimicrobium sp.]